MSSWFGPMTVGGGIVTPIEGRATSSPSWEMSKMTLNNAMRVPSRNMAMSGANASQ